MQNEKQNKHIQQTVGELQQLPDGFAFNSQKVWTGLEQQLPAKKKNYTTWYYAAAAVLLVSGAAYFSVLTSNTGQLADKQLTAGLSVPGKPKTVVVPVIHRTNNQPAPVSALHAVKKQAIQPSAIKSFEDKKVDKIETVPAPLVIAPADQMVADVPPAEQVNTEEKKKLPAIASTKPAPKKYKIIHLNELMQSATTTDLQNTLSKSELKKMMHQQNDEKETTTPIENNTRQLFFFKIKPATTTNTISIVEN